MDEPVYDKMYGYRTAFLYLDFRDQKKLLSEEWQLSRALQLRIPCGRFSYAAISPQCILGVSGTLEVLGAYEWEVMRRYKIDVYSAMPSVYGKSNFRFLNQAEDSIIVESTEGSYYQAIAHMVKQKVDQERAVIVFFKDIKALNRFMETDLYASIPNKGDMPLTEERKPEEKDHIVRKAATCGQVTFATAVFGRGTDFVIHDDKLKEVGGVHVLQTYYSEESTEERQIQGRTARQGKKGSFSLVLFEPDLTELFGIAEGELQRLTPDRQYDLLKDARANRHANACVRVEERLEIVTEANMKTHQFFDALLASDHVRAMEKYADVYALRGKAGAAMQQTCRMVCLSDATDSMGHLWGSAKQDIKTMLERIEEIGGSKFEIMWAAYRDYTEEGGLSLYESSGWSSDPSYLQAFVDNIVCGSGGDGEEAVEHALAQAYEEHTEGARLTRVLLIGDAPPHIEKCGETITYHSHVLTTDYKMEADRFRKEGIPINTFHIAGHFTVQKRTESTFEEIATITGGECHKLTADNLINVVCDNALEDIGGYELVAEYRRRYIS